MLRWLIQPVLAAALAVSLAGCFISGNSVSEAEGESLLGPYSLKWVPARGQPGERALRHGIEQQIEQLTAELLPLSADSPVLKFNRLPVGECLAVPDSIQALIHQLNEVYAFSLANTAADLDPLVRWWLLEEDGSPMSAQDQQPAVELFDGQLCRLSAVHLDLSSLVNSYVLDALAETLSTTGIEDYLLDLAGEVRASGQQSDGRPWRVAIEAPRDHVRLGYRMLNLSDHAIARAGDYQDLISRSRNQSVLLQGLVAEHPVQQSLQCVTVFAESAAQADTLAHLMMFMGAEQAWKFAEEQGISAFFVERHAERGFVSRGTSAFKALKNSEE